jgi:hypothetical protein
VNKQLNTAVLSIAYCAFVGAAVLFMPLTVGFILRAGAWAMIGSMLLDFVPDWTLPALAAFGLLSSWLGRDWRLLELSILVLLPYFLLVKGLDRETEYLPLVTMTAFVALSIWWYLRFLWSLGAKKDPTQRKQNDA